MKLHHRALVAVTAVSILTACIWRGVQIDSMTPTEAIGTSVTTPLKVFHVDGTISVFPGGARVTVDEVRGVGQHYSMNLASFEPVNNVPLDSVVGIEAFRDVTHAGASFLTSIVATALVVVGGVAIACAADPKCFGSCPTVYTYEKGEEILEAEAFSYSISPLLESRDVDRLGARPDPDGVLRLELRNEALETHYINHVEVIEARHASGRRAYPNQDGRVVSVGPVVAPLSAVDRDGGVRTEELSDRDSLVFATTEERVRAVTSADYWDHVDLAFPRPAGESAALVLRLRNSLLNSILFYDLMLGSHGAEALDWLGRDMNRIGEAVELGDWFSQTMGLRVSVMGPEGWREVTRIGDTGPIAWKEVALVVPVPRDGEELRIRLSFLADEWRIEYAALAADVERAPVQGLPVASIGRIGDPPDDELRLLLAEPDDDYLITTAGTAAYLEFRPTPEILDAERTFFFSSQGYYTEWIRPDWIRSGGASESEQSSSRFEVTPNLVVDLMERWLDTKDAFETRFYETRIPVR
jgi:hypothetical protein